jgi:hypothetical protein
MASEGRHKLGDLRARLEFRSFDSEAGSYRGPVTSAMEAVNESRPLSRARGGGGRGRVVPLPLWTWRHFNVDGAS